MKTFNIYTIGEGNLMQTAIVKEETFNIFAFFFGAIYFAYKNLWLDALMLLIVGFFLTGLSNDYQWTNIFLILLPFASAFLYPVEAKKSIERKGFKLKDRIIANSDIEALIKFHETHKQT